MVPNSLFCYDFFINRTLKILRYILAYALFCCQTCWFKTAIIKSETCTCWVLSITVVSIFRQIFPRVKMNVGVAHSEVNPNTRVMNSRGMWLTYALGVGLLHIVLLSIPFFSVPVAWTLTNVIHNLVSILSCNTDWEVVHAYLFLGAGEEKNNQVVWIMKSHLCLACPQMSWLVWGGRVMYEKRAIIQHFMSYLRFANAAFED